MTFARLEDLPKRVVSDRVTLRERVGEAIDVEVCGSLRAAVHGNPFLSYLPA